MADLTRDDVLKLAKLARLHLTAAEVDKFRDEISAILNYVEQLQSADVTGLKPTFQVTGLTNVMRADQEVDYGTSHEELLKNAPSVEKSHFKVKRMVG